MGESLTRFQFVTNLKISKMERIEKRIVLFRFSPRIQDGSSSSD